MKQQPKNLGAPAGSKRWKSDDGSVEIVSTELLFCDATDLGADMMAAVGMPAGMIGVAMRQGFGVNVGEAIGMFARELVGGKLTGYLTRVLANTTLIVRGEGAGTFSMDSREALDKALTGRQKYIAPAVKLALEVSFTGFLDGLALIGIELKNLMPTISPSEDSSQSTIATG